MVRIPDRPGMDGILVVAKPAGMTSHDVVALVRRLSGTRRIGHGGTLDPFATGVLPLFMGHATRLAEYHLGATKRYRATICLGASSTTDDLSGELTPSGGPPPDRAAVAAALGTQLGERLQRPPVFSAIQVGGRRAYDLAREGRPPDLAPRRVVIEAIDLVGWDAIDEDRPIAVVEVVCSAGTYVRAIARDLGASLGFGAYLGALERTASGAFRLADAHDLEVVRRSAAVAGAEGVGALLLPPDAGLGHLPAQSLSADEVGDIARGRFVRPVAGIVAAGPGLPVRLVDPSGRIVGIGARDGRRIAPAKLLIDVAPYLGGGTASGTATHV